MLLVRFSAEDLRTIARAKLPQEKDGVLTLLSDRIEQAKVLKEFGREPTVKPPSFAWQGAFKVAQEVLGDAVKKPPYPDYRWYQRINGIMKANAFDEARVRDLAEYCKVNLLGKRKVISFDFMITQFERILSGEFDSGGAKDAATLQSPRMGPELPEE